MTEATTTAQKTLEEKLADALARVEKIKAAIFKRDIVGDVQVNDLVTIKYGRLNTARHIDGKVVAVDKGESGTKVVVLDDTFATYTVRAQDITANQRTSGAEPALPGLLPDEEGVSVTGAPEGDPLSAD